MHSFPIKAALSGHLQTPFSIWPPIQELLSAIFPGKGGTLIDDIILWIIKILNFSYLMKIKFLKDIYINLIKF